MKKTPVQRLFTTSLRRLAWTSAAVVGACPVLARADDAEVIGVDFGDPTAIALAVALVGAGAIAIMLFKQKLAETGDETATARRSAATREQLLMDTLARIQGRYIERLDETAGFESLLQDVLHLTDSLYGVMVEGSLTDTGFQTERRALRWREPMPAEWPDLPPLPDLDTPVIRALRSRRIITGESFIDRKPVNFCAIPLTAGDTLVGAIVLANRDGGYGAQDLQDWSPVFRAAAQILYALRQRNAHQSALTAIETAAEQQRLVLDNMADGVLFLDDGLHIVRVNKAVGTLFGYQAEALTGLAASILIDVRERDRGDGFGRRQFRTGASRFLDTSAETEAVRKDGTRFPIEMAVTAIADGGGTAYVVTLHDITRRKEDADALARSEREVRAILDNMADTFYRTDLEGRLVMASRSVTALLGYTPREVLGTRLTDLYEDPEERARFLKVLNAQGGRVTDYRTALRHKNGHRVWVSTNARYWRDGDGNVTGVEGTTRDITQRLKAETAVVESERKFRAIADYTFDWESWIGPDGTVIWVSPGVESITGYNADECLGMDDYPLALVHPDDRDEVADVLSRASGANHQFRILCKDGRELWGALSWQVIADKSGAGLGIRTSVHDITDAKHVETHLVQQAKLATLGETAAGLIHELSQPLNIIRLTAEGSLMKMNASALSVQEQTHQFSLIESQARRMGEIMDHIRVFSRKDSGGIEFYSPLDGVAAAVDLIADQFRAEGISVERRFGPVGGMVRGRQVQLEQVILNLLTNSRDSILERHGAEGGERAITVSVEQDATTGRLHIAVEDTGTGFRQDELDRVFEPFFTTKEVGMGTGLGLSVSFGIISSLSGHLRASNTARGGRVDIDLPCEHMPVTARAAARPSRAPLPAASTDRGHVLVVDDETAAADAIATFVENLGFRVSVGYDGEEAQEIFDADPADVVITDIRMPRCDGHTLINHLRRRVPTLPIIVTTGHFGDARPPDAPESRPDAVIRKPVSLEKLRAALAEATGDT